jgi:WD40 repeat protein
MAFSSDGKVFVSAAEDGHVIVWNPREGSEESRFSGHAGPVRSIALSIDGRLLASGSDDGTVRVWDMARQSLRHTLTGSGVSVLHVAISPDSKYLLSAEGEALGGSGAPVRLWDLLSGREITVLEAQGYGEFCHPPHIRRRGHGLGFTSMRPGDVALDNDTVLEPGMVFMIHPNQYLPETGYLLCGEPVLLTSSGAEPLTAQKAALATVAA